MKKKRQHKWKAKQQNDPKYQVLCAVVQHLHWGGFSPAKIIELVPTTPALTVEQIQAIIDGPNYRNCGPEKASPSFASMAALTAANTRSPQEIPSWLDVDFTAWLIEHFPGPLLGKPYRLCNDELLRSAGIKRIHEHARQLNLALTDQVAGEMFDLLFTLCELDMEPDPVVEQMLHAYIRTTGLKHNA